MSINRQDTHSAANLVHNGGFGEVDSNGNPTGWEVIRPAGLPPVMEVAESPP